MGAVDDKIAELLAKHGVKKEEFDILPDEEEKKDPPERVRFRGEAVLYALEYPLSPRVTKRCKECNEPFLTLYKSVGYCGNECAVIHLRKHFGIAWRPSRDRRKEKWEIQAEPKTIPLKALQAMKAIVAQAEADLGYSIALPEILPFVPKSPYYRNQDNSAASEEDYRISVSPEPLERQLETLSSLVSSEQPALPSLSTTGKKVQSLEPEQSLASVDLLESLFDF
jgi:hypothetical protein